VKLELIKFDNRAVYRNFDRTRDGAVTEHIDLSIGRDLFNEMGKPGQLEVTFKEWQDE